MIITLLVTQIAVFAYEMLGNNTFDDGDGRPWHVIVTVPAKAEFEVKNGKYYIKVINPGAYKWDIQFRHTGLKITDSHLYAVKFTSMADKNQQAWLSCKRD